MHNKAVYNQQRAVRAFAFETDYELPLLNIPGLLDVPNLEPIETDELVAV